jgi:hypothetical protein
VAQYSLELEMLFPEPPKYGNCRCVLQCLHFIFLLFLLFTLVIVPSSY